MLSPKRVKYRKPHLTALRGYSKGATEVDFGEFGLQACENGWITARQIEAVRVAISRKMKKGGKIWIRIFSSTILLPTNSVMHILSYLVSTITESNLRSLGCFSLQGFFHFSNKHICRFIFFNFNNVSHALMLNRFHVIVFLTVQKPNKYFPHLSHLRLNCQRALICLFFCCYSDSSYEHSG